MNRVCISRILTRCLLLAIVGSGAGSVEAQTNFPSKPIEIIVPFGPGSNVERLLKTTTPYLQNELGADIRISSIPGDGGSKGLAELTKTDRGGYLLAFTPPRPLLINPKVTKTPYTLGDFIAVAQVGVFYTGLVVPAGSKWRTAQDFIDDALKNPGAFTYATGGELSLAHLAMEALSQVSGMKIKHSPFDNGGAAVRGVMEGRADIAMTDIQAQFSKDGKTRILAIATETRLSDWPEVPTFKELGYDVVFDVWQGIVAHKGTPAEVVAKLESAMKKVAEMPGYRQAVSSGTGATTAFLGSKDWAAKWAREDKAFESVLSGLATRK